MKRLYTEAYTMAAYDIQVRSDVKDPEELRKRPNAECEHRFDSLRNRLVGLNLDSDMRTISAPPRWSYLTI